MWYKNPEAIDLDKPIAAKNKGKMYLLLPQVAPQIWTARRSLRV